MTNSYYHSEILFPHGFSIHMYVDVSPVSFQTSNPMFPQLAGYSPWVFFLNCKLSSLNVKNSSSSLQIQVPL